MPVSNAAMMAPNAAPRRDGATCRITCPRKSGYADPNPVPKTSAESTNIGRPPPMASSAKPATTSPRHGRRIFLCPMRSPSGVTNGRDTSVAIENTVKYSDGGETPEAWLYIATKLVMPP